MTASIAPARRSLAELHAQVGQFYADHFYLLDSGRAEEWAQTFTEDGEFWPPNRPEPLRGREVLAAGVREAHAGYEEQDEQRRHWHGMVSVQPQDDGSLVVRCYAQILVTAKGGPTRLHLSCVCHDRFVWDTGQWRVQSRRVTRDDLP